MQLKYCFPFGNEENLDLTFMFYEYSLLDLLMVAWTQKSGAVCLKKKKKNQD